MYFNIKKVSLTILLFLSGVSFCFSQQIIEGFAQGTTYRIVFYPGQQPVTKTQTDSLLNRLDSSLSRYKPYSLISRFNRAETEEIEMDEHLKKVVLSSQEHWKKSKGVFDITIGSLSRLYGFIGGTVSHQPSQQEIKTARAKIGMKKLSIEGNMLRKLQKGIEIDVDGIAQGYTVDVMGTFLEQKGIENYLVEIGGEIISRGTHPDGRKFKLAIEYPENLSFENDYEVLEVYNMAVTSSGTVRKHHIHPKSGKIISTPILSATVIAKTAMESDAIDNYIIFMKPQKALKWADKNGVKVILITKDKIYRSKD